MITPSRCMASMVTRAIMSLRPPSGLSQPVRRQNTDTVYRASSLIRVGTIQGRGRYDREKLCDKPRKDVWLQPLRRDWQRTLNR